MSLRDYVPSTRTVTLKGDNKLTVRGLAFEDMQHFLINRGELVSDLLALLEESGFDVDKMEVEQTKNIGVKLISSLPNLVAEVIAIGADEPDMILAARRLPAPKQLELLEGVYSLTFEEPGSVKKFFDQLIGTMQSIPKKKTAPSLKTSVGTNNSGETSGS